jgi:hypothetical protein
MEAAGAARAAVTAMSEWIERNAVADFETADLRTYFDHLAGRLVAEHEWKSSDHSIRAELPIDDMKIRTAYAARANPHQQLGFAGLRPGHLDYFSARAGTRLGNGFHLSALPSLQYDFGALRVKAVLAGCARYSQ